MAVVAQLVEHLIVIQDVAGSSPVDRPFLEKDYSSFRFYKAGIFNKSYLTNKEGRYKDYPYRMVDAGLSGGYSDHFPVYVYLVKEIE